MRPVNTLKQRMLLWLLIVQLGCLALWFVLSNASIVRAINAISLMSLTGIVGLYLLAHVFRMLRLMLLTLDKRNAIFSLISVHALSAFPSYFFPFKIGEVIRLVGFFYVYDGDRKALAVWLLERFGDILTIASFILALYLFNIAIPDMLRMVFILFVVASVLALCAYAAISKVSAYLNRHLVLSSTSSRGLQLLKISSVLHRFEASLYASIEGRFFGLILFSIAIWGCELLAVVTFLRSISSEISEVTQQFLAILSGRVPQAVADSIVSFSTYQAIALAGLALAFVILVAISRRAKLLG